MLKGLNHITLAVSDIEASLKFYTDVLGFEGHVKWNSGAYLSLGALWLCISLDQPDNKTDYTHIAFDIDQSDFCFFADYLEQNGVKQWKENVSEGDSIYILDPDGHKLEIHCGNLQSRLDSLSQDEYKRLIKL